VLIKITYVTELSVEGPNIAFVLPASVSPPQRDKALKDITQTATKTVDVAGDASSGLPLDLQVSIDMPYPIVRLKSSSHPGRLLIKQTQTKATVQLKPNTSLEGRPFTLLVGLEKPYEPRMWVRSDLIATSSSLFGPEPDGPAAPGRGRRQEREVRSYGRLLPRLPVRRRRYIDGPYMVERPRRHSLTSNRAAPDDHEFIFLVDRSSSMKGEPFEDMKRCLSACLERLAKMDGTVMQC
jgi:hypothetical protein